MKNNSIIDTALVALGIGIEKLADITPRDVIETIIDTSPRDIYDTAVITAKAIGSTIDKLAETPDTTITDTKVLCEYCVEHEHQGYHYKCWIK